MNIELKILDWFQTLAYTCAGQIYDICYKAWKCRDFLDHIDGPVSFDTEDEKNRCSHGGCLDHRFIIMQRIVKKFRGADQTV